MASIKNNFLGDDGHQTLGEALIGSTTAKLAYLTCDKFSIGPDDVALDLQGKGLNPKDGILLAGVLKSNSVVSSIKSVQALNRIWSMFSKVHIVAIALACSHR